MTLGSAAAAAAAEGERLAAVERQRQHALRLAALADAARAGEGAEAAVLSLGELGEGRAASSAGAITAEDSAKSDKSDKSDKSHSPRGARAETPPKTRAQEGGSVMTSWRPPPREMSIQVTEISAALFMHAPPLGGGLGGGVGGAGGVTPNGCGLWLSLFHVAARLPAASSGLR